MTIVRVEISSPVPPVPQLYRVNHDATLWRAGLPEVFRLSPDQHVPLCEAVQWLWRRINPQLTDDQWRRCLGNQLAFTNGTGFPGRHDYINNLDIEAKDPAMDQMRVCGGAFLAGTVSGTRLLVEGVDIRNPIPSAGYVLARPWLYFEAININVSDGAPVIRPLKGDWGVPVYVPVLVSTEASFPLSGLTCLDMSSPLPSPYRYP